MLFSSIFLLFFMLRRKIRDFARYFMLFCVGYVSKISNYFDQLKSPLHKTGTPFRTKLWKGAAIFIDTGWSKASYRLSRKIPRFK